MGYCLPELLLSSSACESTSTQDPFEQYLPNLSDQCRYSTKLNKCDHLGTIESYQASLPVQQVSAKDKPKLLLYTITKCKIKLLKVFFESGSIKTMNHCSTLPSWFQSATSFCCSLQFKATPLTNALPMTNNKTTTTTTTNNNNNPTKARRTRARSTTTITTRTIKTTTAQLDALFQASILAKNGIMIVELLILSTSPSIILFALTVRSRKAALVISKIDNLEVLNNVDSWKKSLLEDYPNVLLLESSNEVSRLWTIFMLSLLPDASNTSNTAAPSMDPLQTATFFKFSFPATIGLDCAEFDIGTRSFVVTSVFASSFASASLLINKLRLDMYAFSLSLTLPMEQHCFDSCPWWNWILDCCWRNYWCSLIWWKFSSWSMTMIIRRMHCCHYIIVVITVNDQIRSLSCYQS